MSRRPSTISAASGSSLPSAARVSKSPSFSPPVSRRPSSASWAQRSASISSTLASQASLAPASLDPDDLFTKYSVAEVRNVQMRLRADADAKQEELRIMVGERYRDLLQASSSIIAIAESSVRVQDALEEMREAIPGPDFELHMPRRAGSGRKEDSHLKALQSLAAHMKLLLDTPEHLWRLIERKKYLHACWLFLLARVIHHALVRPNVEGDEEDWKTHGIDVEEQFPIVQRQWEAVGPFKSQIAYKATLSLREPSLSIEDICSVLLTLNLLDSEPLTKTLNTFLLQRTRSLQTSLTRPASSSGQPSQVPNGSAPKTRKTIIREVRESLALVLQVIALTISAARRIFRHSPSSPSLMMRVLAFIDAPEPSPIIPVELQMSTQALLSNLPSTSHFALLPASIRMYKPYIDLDSPATTVASPHLVERIQQWFEQAVVELKRAASGWFAAVESLTDLWELRRWTRAWAENESQLEAAERDLLLETLDTVVRTHAAELWKARLADMESEFNSELVAAVTALVDGTEEGLLEASPTTFLFQVPPQVSTFKFSGVSMAASFQNYSAALQRQITGRTPLLDRVLSAVENRSAALHEDLMSTTAGGQDDREVLTAYRPDADTFFTAVVTATSSTLERLTDESEATVRALAFLSRTVLELSSSPFLADVRHGTDAGAGFEEQARELHDMAVERWRQLTCESIIRDYVEAWDHISEASRSLNETSGVPSLPSSSLMQALLALASACHSANASMHLARSAATASMTLQVFIGSLLDSLEQRDILGAHRQPLLWDLRLLRKLASLWGNELVPITQGLDERIASMESKSGDDPPPDSDAAVAEHLARTHLLLAPLLPPSFAPVAASKSVRKDNVPNGLLFADTSPQPMMELVKPGPRFGMLLVESTAVE